MDTWRGHKVARLVDHLCPRAWTAPLVALLVDAMRGRKAVAVFLERMTPQPQQTLAALGCFPVGAVTQFVVKTGGSAAAITAPGDSAQWFVTCGDSDSDMPHESECVRNAAARVRGTETISEAGSERAA
jgi:hypothetical protein